MRERSGSVDNATALHRKARFERNQRIGSAEGKASQWSANDFPLMNPDDIPPAALNPEKDPDDWSTGNEPMTGPQRSYLQTLCREAGEEFDETLTKAAASRKIEELQAKTGRGRK